MAQYGISFSQTAPCSFYSDTPTRSCSLTTRSYAQSVASRLPK